MLTYILLRMKPHLAIPSVHRKLLKEVGFDYECEFRVFNVFSNK